MNKNLWRIIGLQKNESSIQELSECSTIKVVECPVPVRNDTSQDDMRLFSSGPLKYQPVAENQNVSMQKINKVFNPADLDIQACQSLSENSVKVQDKNDKKQAFKQEDQARYNKLKLQIIFLKEDNESLKVYVCKAIKDLNQLVQKLYTYFVDVMIKKYYDDDTYLKQKCKRCDSHKKMIDSLTKQCWDLEQNIRQKTNQCQKLKIKIQSTSQLQNPLKAVEEGLFEQRSQSIKKIKSEIQILNQQNQKLKTYLQVSKDEKQSMEIRYNRKLSELHKQIFLLNQFAMKEVQSLAQKNSLLQNQLTFINRKYSNLQHKYSMIRQQRLLDNRYEINQLDRSCPILQNKSSVRSTQRLNTNKTPKVISRQQLPDYRSSYIKYDSQQISQPALQYLGRSNKQIKLRTQPNVLNLILPINKDRAQKSKYSAKTPIGDYGKKINLSNALDRLGQLKRQVNRQIKRSKLATK